MIEFLRGYILLTLVLSMTLGASALFNFVKRTDWVEVLQQKRYGFPLTVASLTLPYTSVTVYIFITLIISFTDAFSWRVVYLAITYTLTCLLQYALLRYQRYVYR